MVSRGILGAGSIPFIGCVVLLVAMVLDILSFASPFWAKDSFGEFGLWRTSSDYCAERSFSSCRQWADRWESSDWFKAVQGLECCTIFFWAVPLVILPVYIYVAMGLYYKCLLGTMSVFTFLGTACNLTGVIIFGIQIEDKSELSLRWCLPTCAAGGVLGFGAFIVFFISFLNRPKFEPEQHFLSGFYADPDKNRMYVVQNVDPPATVITARNGDTIDPGQVDSVETPKCGTRNYWDGYRGSLRGEPTPYIKQLSSLQPAPNLLKREV
ncbi:hypothetical protein RRG08_058574 [Elysia crispata]|uniref:Uncharacterized protein n=1 Tax=Elysia crispata TaxID=231223 RepID=A0AAE1CMI2_9GAST|nr:hypothetical protein RRG08_058574 [Elysia crispata]